MALIRDSYAFIYDDFVSDRQYERQVAEIESRLAALDLTGRAMRLALFRSAKDVVESMVAQGVSTIVVIGNDRTLDKIMWFLPDLDVALGYLPVCEPRAIGDLLGIPRGAEACDVLAARFIESLDVGKLNDRYFLTEARLVDTVAAIDVEGRYRISAAQGGMITVRNLGSVSQKGSPQGDARDGLLEVIVSPRTEVQSRWMRKKEPEVTRVLLSHGEIVSPVPVEVNADNYVVSGMRFSLAVLPKKLKIITGRGRTLSPNSGVLQKSSKVVTLPTATDARNRAGPWR